jgi:DNA mismatch repair protein MutS
LYKIVPGGVDKSYGIHVGKLAGLPKSVVHRAQEVLDELEEGSRTLAETPPKAQRRPKYPPPIQIPLLGPKSPLLEELEKLDIDAMTPLEAITRLYEMQKKAREEG